MKKIVFALTFAALLVGPAAASDKTDILAPVQQFVAGFNTGDVPKATAVCTDELSIIDDFPPHEWHGAGAVLRWFADFGVEAKKNVITEGRVTLGTPRHIDVNGDRAYVVIPSNFTYKMKGKPMKQTGSMFTFALQKTGVGWRIAAWSWAKN